MSIPLECPACHHGFAAPDNFAGKRGKCPKCGEVFRALPVEVPTFPEVADPPPPPPNESSSGIDVFPAMPPRKKSAAHLSDSGAVNLNEIHVEPTGRKAHSLSAISVPGEPVSNSDSGAIPVFPATPAARAAKPPVVAGKDAAPAKAAPAPLGSVATPLGSVAAPLGKAVGGPSVTVGVTTGPHGTAHGMVSNRPKSESGLTPYHIVVGVVMVLCVAAGMYGLYRNLRNSPNPDDGNGGVTKGNETPGPDDPTTPPTTPTPPRPPVVPPVLPADPAALAAVKESAGKSLVRVEALHGATRRSGLGVVVDARGWIATLYDVVQGASHAEIVFAGDIRQSVEGHAGLDLPHGLILLKVPTLPEGIEPLTVRSNAPPAVGERYYPAVLAEGKPDFADVALSANLPKARLPFAVEKSLSGDLRGADDLVVLEFDAVIAERAAGGPLVDRDGRIAGICLALSGAVQKGYAVDARHLTALLASATGEVRPLDPTKIAGAEGPDEPLIPTLPEKPVPMPMPVPEENNVTATAIKLAELREQCRKQKFAASTAEEYARLQELAGAFSRLELDAESTLRDDVDRALAAAAVTAALEDLSDFVWPDVAATNQRAVEALASAPTKPVFMYAAFRGRQGNVALFSLVGSPLQFVAIELKQGADELTENSQWLIVGRPETTRRVEVNGQSSPYISTRHLIGKPPG